VIWALRILIGWLVLAVALQSAAAVVHHATSHRAASHAVLHAESSHTHACTGHHHHHDAPADEPDSPADSSQDCPTCVLLASGLTQTLPAFPSSHTSMLPSLSGVPPDGMEVPPATPLARSHPSTGPPALA
jgi:hypothetical protein